MHITKTDIKKSIIKSQHCQRNWDLEKEIPESDLELLVHAVTECPSKQNAAFYNVFVITDRNLIEDIHSNTSGFYIVDEDKTVTNSQTLANLLFVFTDNTKKSSRISDKLEKYGDSLETIQRDLLTNIGVASGYLNLTATIIGYSTGCCQCFDKAAIKKLLNTDEDIMLMMGVGHKGSISRKVHHADKETIFPSFKKEKITVTKL